VEADDGRRPGRGGNAQRRRGAKKLVSIDRANIVIGDFFSASTTAVAPAVTIGQGAAVRGGTNPSLTKLNTPGQPTLLWRKRCGRRPAGQVLAQLMAEAFGKTPRSTSTFATTPTATAGRCLQGGVDGQRRQNWQDVEGDATARLKAGRLTLELPVSFGHRQTFGSTSLSETRGNGAVVRLPRGASLTDCGGNAKVPEAAVPGFRSTAANVKSGSSFKAFSDLYLGKVGGTTFNSGTSEAFDAVFVSFLAAVAGKSDDPTKISPGIVKVTNPPGALERVSPRFSRFAGLSVLVLMVAGPPNTAPGGLRASRGVLLLIEVRPGRLAATRTMIFGSWVTTVWTCQAGRDGIRPRLAGGAWSRARRGERDQAVALICRSACSAAAGSLVRP
jgi:hypothetical protein